MARLSIRMDPIFTEDILKYLNLKGIWTAIDFLEENTDRLATICRIPYKDIVKAKNNIITKFSSFTNTGKTLYSVGEENFALVPTGIRSFDELLGGGLLSGHVYEICGLSASCKTQVCLTITTHLAHTYKQKVYYIDAKSEFSPSRIFYMMKAREIPENSIMDTLKRIEVAKVKNVFELISFLNTFGDTFRKRLLEGEIIRCVILDSLPTLFFPCVNSSDFRDEGMALLNCCANMMKYLAREYHLVFVVVNLAMNGNEAGEVFVADPSSIDTIKPAFGKHWLHVPSTRWLITREEARLHIQTIKSINIQLGLGGFLILRIIHQNEYSGTGSVLHISPT